MKPVFFGSNWLKCAGVALAISTPFSQVLAKDLILAWDPSPDSDTVGYAIYYTQATGSAVNRFQVGADVATATLDLTEGQSYTVFTTSIMASGNESPPSNFITFTLSSSDPSSNPPPAPAPSLLKNGSFESGFQGWAAGGNLAVDSTIGSDGGQSIRFNGGDLPANAILLQSFGTTPGAAYVVEFDMAAASSSDRFEQSLVASVKGSKVLTAQAFSVTSDPVSVVWASAVFAFVADTDKTTLIFQDVSPENSNVDLLLDNVRVTANQ